MDKNDQPILAYDNWDGPKFTYSVINSFNSSGDSLWAVEFSDDTSAHGIVNLIRDNNNFIYTGILQLQIINRENIYNSDIACVKDGVLIWEKHIERTKIHKILIDLDNNLITLTQDDPRVYKINSATGETIWEKNLYNNTANHSLVTSNIYGIDVDQLNNIVIAENDSAMTNNILIKKFSPAGEELWSKDYSKDKDLNNYPSAIAIDKENSIYITGFTEDPLLNKSYIFKMSGYGELIWEYSLNNFNYELLYLSPIFIKDSSLFVAGSLFNSETSSNIFLMRLDQNLSSDIANTPFNPYTFKLYQNYPNPFNPTTKIQYSIPNVETGHALPLHVVMKVYDILGNEIATPVDENKPAGKYKITFDASKLSSGVYFYKLQAGSYMQTKKMILLR